MLKINSKIGVGDIAAVKTERFEVIGKVGSVTDGSVSLILPLVVQPMQGGDGSLHMGFVPYAMTAEDDQAFSFTGDIFSPRKAVKDGYLKQTSSLVLPESGLILPKK